MKKEGKKEGLVKDLIEKRTKGEITEKEAYQEIYRRGLEHGKYGSPLSNTLILLGHVLPFLPIMVAILNALNNIPSLAPFIERLTFMHLLQLPRIIFPQSVTYLAAAAFVTSALIMVQAAFLRAKKGGCGWKGESETIMLVTEGIYGVVRQPAHLSSGLILLSLTISLSEWLPFTFLSAMGIILVFVGFYYSSIEEEELNLLKWGDDYRQYMKEVPRFNFILGLLRRTTSKR
ncbi:MAG: hypothetical protein NWE88_09510 [Candidatus Bathyarchaeota archaeon]|nr:hypothetical protein [Candidatus Bathyarchaeota archaeon]